MKNVEKLKIIDGLYISFLFLVHYEDKYFNGKKNLNT